jgi:hypothetical protein
MATKNEKDNEKTTEKNLVNINDGQNDLFAGLSDLSDFKGDTTGLEALDPSDIKMPKIKLIQPTSLEATKGVCPAGWFFNTVTKEKSESIDCVLLRFEKSRVKWKKPFKRGEEPLCKSYDGKKKSDGTMRCENCPDSKWDNLGSEQTKPECNMSYVWLGLDGKKSPFRFIASGMSVSPTKDFLNLIAPRNYPVFVYRVNISSVQKENDQGVFYVMQYNVKGIVSKEDAAGLKEASVAFQELFARNVQRDTNTLNEDMEEASGKSGLF